MIVYYPKEYKKNAPNNRLGVEVVLFDENTPFAPQTSGMYDTFLIIVQHSDNCSNLNYINSYSSSGNYHMVNTVIDCNFHSPNLETLINKFKQTEDIWLT